MGQRYAVLPLQAPHLEGNSRGFGKGFRGYRGSRGYKGKYPQDKQKENRIKEDVENVLLDKFETTNQWTKEQKEGMKNTLKAQASVYADMILEQAESECYKTLPKEDESISVDEEQGIFYEKLHNTAIDIAERQFEIDKDFDIEEAIKREKSLLSKVQNGEMTSYEARSYLEEPLLYKGEINNSYKQYVDLYSNFTTRRREKTIETGEETRQKDNNGNKRTEATRTQKKREQTTSNQKTNEQTRSETRGEKQEEKEYLNIKTVRRDGREEVGGVKGTFINLGIKAQRLILKIYEKIPKVFRDSLEELGKNGFSKKWRYLFLGAAISRLDDTHEERMSEEKMRFHQRVEVPPYDGPHHCECHHDEPHDFEPDYYDPHEDR